MFSVTERGDLYWILTVWVSEVWTAQTSWVELVDQCFKYEGADVNEQHFNLNEFALVLMAQDIAKDMAYDHIPPMSGE